MLKETISAKSDKILINGNFLHEVKVPLSEKELLAYADELTECDTRLSELQGELEIKKAEFKTKIGDVNLRANELMNLLKTKEEYKEIECFDDFNWFDGIVEIKRVDTNETVRTRKITREEYQQNLPMTKPEIADDDDSGDEI